MNWPPRLSCLFKPQIYTECVNLTTFKIENTYILTLLLLISLNRLPFFFLSNAVETQLVSTGAFEITVDKMPVWSKIESGRIPQPPELFQIVDTHLKMNTGTF